MKLINQLVVTTLPFIPKQLIRFFANRYISGETLESATDMVSKLNSKGAMATLDVLGEDITNRFEASQALEKAKETLRAISGNRLDSNLSLKLTQYGLKLDKEFCLSNVREIIQLAAAMNNFVRIDMEDHTCTDDTLEVYSRLRREFPNVGVVIQAYLRRSETDVNRLFELGANFRLCKGIYVEPEAIAFKDRREIQDNYLRLLETMLSKQAYVGIATHDDYLIDGSTKLLHAYAVEKNKYEFQMLLGVRTELRDALIREGHRVRIYVPFGVNWHQYSLRRFKENPEIAGYVLKAAFDFIRINGHH